MPRFRSRLPRATPAGGRRQKYDAVPTVYRQQRYDSKLEAAYAAHLDLLLAAGEIAGWRRGREWVLLPGKKRTDRITYRPDFEVWTQPDERDLTLQDTKGKLTPVFKLKAKLFRHAYPAHRLYVVQQGRRSGDWQITAA